MEETPIFQQVLDDVVPAESPFSKMHFLQFLVAKHCMENYDCYQELLRLHQPQQKQRLKHWTGLYCEYIESDLINLPESLARQLDKFELPPMETLDTLIRLLLGFLFGSYCDFTSSVKASLNDVPEQLVPTAAAARTQRTKPLFTQDICKTPQPHTLATNGGPASPFEKFKNRFRWRRKSDSTTTTTTASPSSSSASPTI